MLRSALVVCAVASICTTSPILAAAQTTITRETVTTTAPMTLAPQMRNKARAYVVEHRRPSVVIQDRVAPGIVLPPDAQFYSFEGDGFGPYRYAYVNDAPVLVDPGSRRVIEVFE